MGLHEYNVVVLQGTDPGGPRALIANVPGFQLILTFPERF